MRPILLAILAAGLAEADGQDPARVRAAVEKAVPLLQRASPVFTKKTGCISCHQNTLPAMAVATARQHGLAVDESAERLMLHRTANYIGDRTERILEGITPPGAEDTLSYVLLGLAVEDFPGNAATSASARYLKLRQAEDGRWRIRAHRPPLESSSISLTAVTIQVLQAYAPPAQQEQYAQSIAHAARWLMQAEARNTEESTFKVLGLVWAHAPAEAIAQAAAAVANGQRADGGWSQLATLESDAYATGQALVALAEAGMKTSDARYRRGVAFLLKTQHADGSWFVKSRSEAFQPYLESGFPYGHDQWISAAGTSWAVTALCLTQPKGDTRRTARTSAP